VIFVPVKLSKALVTSLQLLLSALLLCAAPWAAIADEDSQLSRDLKLEAFPALQASEDSLRLVDVNHEHTTLSTGFSGVPGSQGLDLSSSYVWESAAIADGVRESSSLLPLTETAIGFKPERENSITFSWQIGNHTATAVTRHSDALDQLGLLSLDALNVDDLNELVGQITMLDLRYAYNVRAGRTGNASIALGVRNMFERKAQTSAFSNTSSSGQPAGNMAYGTIKYQF
jgi:hypothetical protein